ncbi:hypothetical protein [Chryseobacterium angstadtii]|uniref:hypothetical protein n=1 Tax=Chryseobacterium angstadtii TaxID=558151 RepID=UPI00065AD2BF|nr:hypothetical protein [Chryseobacterium angstadtii]
MRKIILPAILSCFSFLSAQVGINTTTPTATLDVIAQNATSTSVDGIIAPRIDRLRAFNMSGVPNGTLIYINNIGTGSATGQTANVTSTGYYYFEGTAWQKLTTANIYSSDGTLNANRTVTMGTNNIAWNSTAATTTATNLNANSVTTGKALDISTTGLTTGTAFNITSSNAATNTNGVIKVANTSASGAGTFATLQANSTAGSGLNILNNGNVGVGISTPNSTLNIEGSFEAGYKEVTASTTLTDKDHYITFSGTTANQTITLPTVPATAAASFSGRIYRIKNISTQSLTLAAAAGATLRPTSTNVSTYILPAGAYMEVVCNTNLGAAAVWDLSYLAQTVLSNVEIYGGQALIPPHNSFAADFSNHTVATYDTADWQVISKTSTNTSTSGTGSTISITNAKQVIVYEYQGTPFTLTNLFPILTPGNNSGFPDVYTANFVSIANTGTGGKTRLTVSVTRSELNGNGTNWAGTFLLNILLAKKVN